MSRAGQGLAVAFALAGMLSIPVAATAFTQSGPNGKIAFVSGRDGGDQEADVYILSGPNGTVTPFTSAAGQHRHPAWSPDRSEIAYALFESAAVRDLWVRNVANGGGTRIINTNNVQEDRPSWSPDGTKIAYESEVMAGSGQMDILISNTDGSGTVNLTSTPGEIEGKPVWSPDGQTIYYSRYSTGGVEDADIYAEPSDNSVLVNPPAILAGANNEFQPALSPDGSELCFTRGATGPFATDSTAEVYKVAATGVGTQTNISDDAAVGDYNCTWSPDGTKIAYAHGIFGTAALTVKNSNDTGLPSALTPDVVGVFDGNPDWATNPAPSCGDGTATTTFNASVTIPLSCSDPEDEELTLSIVAGPTNGELAAIDQGARTVRYQPDQGYAGPDSFTFKATDSSSDSNTAKISIEVTPPTCKGREATIFGGAGNDNVRGTGGDDVIAGLEGADKIKAGGGKDRVCGGAGKDKLKDQAGKDKLLGEAGKDRLTGGAGKDKCVGGGGKDVADCEKEKSI